MELEEMLKIAFPAFLLTMIGIGGYAAYKESAVYQQKYLKKIREKGF